MKLHPLCADFLKYFRKGSHLPHWAERGSVGGWVGGSHESLIHRCNSLHGHRCGGQLEGDKYWLGLTRRIQRRQQPWKSGWLRVSRLNCGPWECCGKGCPRKARGHDKSLANEVTWGLDAFKRSKGNYKDGTLPWFHLIQGAAGGNCWT